jgi:hypothetical protein
MSSPLPPEDLVIAGRHSVWRGFKLVVDAVSGGLAALGLNGIGWISSRAHQLLTDPKRKRQTGSRLKCLS